MHFCVHIKVHSTLKRKTPIMNFDLKTLDLAAAASEKCDLLVVLLPEGFKPGKDALSALAALALKNGDLATKAGKHLQLYQVPAVAARRVVLVGQGDGSARATRQALQAVGVPSRRRRPNGWCCVLPGPCKPLLSAPLCRPWPK